MHFFSKNNKAGGTADRLTGRAEAPLLRRRESHQPARHDDPTCAALSRTLDVLGRSALGGSGESNVLSYACWQMTRKGTHLCCAQASGTRSVIPTDNATILTVQLRKYESGRAEAVPSLPLCAGSGAYCVLPAPRIGAANTSGTPLRPSCHTGMIWLPPLTLPM